MIENDQEYAHKMSKDYAIRILYYLISNRNLRPVGIAEMDNTLEMVKLLIGC